MEKIMFIDGNSIVNRAFYGVPILTNKKGIHTNAIYGFLNILFKLLDDENPDYLGVCFDVPKKTFRHEAYPEYKGTRKTMPDELKEQMPILKKLLETMNISLFELEGFEADDLLGTLSFKTENMNLETIVVSGDTDLLQIASNTLKVKIPKTSKGKTVVKDYFASDVLAEYELTPTEFIDYKALMGDKSDNVPGVPSIGNVTSKKIIMEYHTVENAIENALDVKPKKASLNLVEFKEQALFSKFLVTIVRDAPIEININDMKTDNYFNENSFEIFKELEIKKYLGKFKENVKKTSTQMSFDDNGNIIDDDEKSVVNKKEVEEEIDNYILIESIDEANNYLHKFDNYVGEIAYVMHIENNEPIAIGLYNDEHKGVVFCINNFSDFILDGFINCFKKFFENESIKKIGTNIKESIKLLKKFDINIKNVYFDTSIAAYIINPTDKSYDYDLIAYDFLEKEYESFEDVLGKGKSLKTLTELERGKKLKFIGNRSKVCYKSCEIMKNIIEKNDQNELYYDIEMPLVWVLAEMEQFGILVDQKILVDFQKTLDHDINNLVLEIYEMAGETFNINSPKQLGVILFEKMGLKGGKKTKAGSYSTGAEILENMNYPIIEKIILYRQLTKLKSTYVVGLLNVIDPRTNRIHSTFNQTITATGRISSTEPNLQNIPIKLEIGRNLRKAFVPKDGYVFLDADYSQIELRVLAHMANEQKLIEAFKNDEDIHTLTASEVFNVSPEDVTPLHRRNAKAVNFGIVYGMGAFSLAKDLDIRNDEAKEYINKYFEKYPNVKKYLDDSIVCAKNDGYAKTLYNRRRKMVELNSKSHVERAFGERVSMNMPIQGTAADIIKIAMIKVSSLLKERKLKSRLILQVHDELMIEAYKSEVSEVLEILKIGMEEAVELSVPISIDVNEGASWFLAK